MENFIATRPLTMGELKNMAEETFGDMVKAVADISTGTVAFSGGMHADAEKLLLENGSTQENLWGFNIYPDRPEADMLEFQSLINIRPRQLNRSMEIQDETIRQTIRTIMKALVV